MVLLIFYKSLSNLMNFLQQSKRLSKLRKNSI